jgi:TrmH family RNA methyltransferase
MDIISSRSNSKVRRARSLKMRKMRQESGFFLVEGIWHVGEAVAAAERAGVLIDSIFYAPDLLRSEFAHDLIYKLTERGVSCFATTAEVFETIASKENPQGILALVHVQERKLHTLDPVYFPWLVALISPQDPGNVGAILRTIDAVGASGLLLLDNTVDPHHPSSVRASMGSLFWYPIVQGSYDEFAQWVKQHGYHVYGTSAHGNIGYMNVQSYERPAVLLMGSERSGLTSEQANLCQLLLRLPMEGRITSLNLAVATGVMLYAMRDKFLVNPENGIL